MIIGLIDFDGKLPNLALMKISTFYKSLGCNVYLHPFPKNVKMDKVFCAVLFSWNKHKAAQLQQIYPSIEYGGTGWDIKKKLPAEIESCQPDHNLYTQEEIYKRICRGIGTKEKKLQKAETIRNAGIGFTSRGCVRNCAFCIVPKKEGKLYQVSEIKDIINPNSNVITLLDNNLTADPYCIEKLNEIRDRNLVVDISQGIDVRLITPEIAQALGEVKHLRSLHYAWDLMNHEKSVMEGIKILSQHVKKYKHMCFMLLAFDSTFEEDMYRFKKLREINVDPFAMVYNKQGDTRTGHFARWINSRIYKSCTFAEYEPWVKAKGQLSFDMLQAG